MASFSANALDLDVRSSGANVLDFSLLIEHSKVVFEEEGFEIKFNLERIGILSFDVPSSGPHFGLALGYAFSDVSDNAVYQSISMDGYYIGIGARADVIKLDSLSVQFAGHYIYQSVLGSEELQEASLSWNEFSVNAIASLGLTSSLYVFAGPQWATIDATYREKGVVRFTENFTNKNNTGYVAGINYQLNHTESLGVQFQNSGTEGFTLRFRKLF